MKTASGQCLRVASSMTSVPLAFTEKSVGGSLAAQSCEGCAAVCTTSADVLAVAGENRVDAVGVADVDVVMGVAGNGGDELAAAPFRRGVGTEKGLPHVVVDAGDVESLGAEEANRLGPDQSRRSQ